MSATKPILFSGPLVRALLAGTKTETRRPVKPQPPQPEALLALGALQASCPSQPKALADTPDWFYSGSLWAARDLMAGREPVWRSPFGSAGTLLWVRETTAGVDTLMDGYAKDPPNLIAWRADMSVRDIVSGWEPEDTVDWNFGHPSVKWTPSIHMRRDACRLVLRVESVGVERVQAIDEDGARAEGVSDEAAMALNDEGSPDYTLAFANLWDGIYSGQGLGWKANPWVWVVRFSVAADTHAAAQGLLQ